MVFIKQTLLLWYSLSVWVGSLILIGYLRNHYGEFQDILRIALVVSLAFSIINSFFCLFWIVEIIPEITEITETEEEEEEEEIAHIKAPVTREPEGEKIAQT